ncbi:hypothetical protein Scep_005499 [Stephania cephalantha]|uniref:Uncharacterized protein n=1 Tax=Stephania cephalantha TaxID=152367 RepID=A0AAP0KX17_9MAGN
MGWFGNSSPVESVVGSTETESDEEDFLAAFMARSMLNDLDPSEPHKARVVAGSPQSTLCAVGSCSSRGSPNGPSQVSSPPSTPVNGKDDAWELLYAAAGQVVRIKMNDEGSNYFRGGGGGGRGLLGPPRKLSPVPSQNLNNSNHGYFSNQGLLTPQQQMQLNQYNQLKQQQQQQQQQQCSGAVWGRQGKMMQQQTQQQHLQFNGGSRPGAYVNSRCGRPLGLPSSAWPPLQPPQTQPPSQQAGSGMRAVFLDGSGTRRECAGTGVFLPRTNRNPEPRKKPGCSTVLLPARVVQALNLNFDDLGGAQTRYVNGLGPVGSNPAVSQQKRHYRPQQAHIKHELRLPQEWTY